MLKLPVPLAFGPVAVAAGIATATLFHFANYSGQSRWPMALGGHLILMLAPLLPVLALVFLIRPGPRLAWIVACSAGTLASAATIYGLTSRPRHGGPLADLGVLLDELILQFVVLELLFLPLIFMRPRLWPFAPQVLFVSGLIAVVTVGGWAVGVGLWSVTVPSRIIAAAERVAAGRPHCLLTEQGFVRSRSDLTAIAMLPEHHHGMSWNFHAVLVLEEPRSLLNWSYASGTFAVFDASRFPEIVRRAGFCQPGQHFAARL